MDETLSRDALAGFEAFAVKLAHAAAGVILPLFRTDTPVDDKGATAGRAFDPVTAADRGAEAAIRHAIAARFPEHGVIGEEYGEDRPDAEFVWVLDPVDGTRAFIAGLPLWTTLIALRWRGLPVVGAIAQPYLGEMFVGSAHGSRLVQGGGATPLAVRPCPALSQAVIATTDPALFRRAELSAWTEVRAVARLARLGCDAYAFAMVALGRLDLVVEAGLKAWDIEAAVPLIAGAGGVVADWSGAPIGPAFQTQGGQCAVAGDRAVLDEALAILGGAAP